MANLPELSQFDSVYQIETTDPVIGGPDGVSNAQAKALTNRTKYLKDLADALGSGKQPLDATLTALAALVGAADKMPYFNGADSAALASLTAFARTLLDDDDAATACGTLGAAPLASPTFTGTPAAPTPAQFDNDTSLATTEFVRRNGLMPAGLAEYSTNTTLTAADVGKVIRATGAVTFTLPAASSVPTGSMFWFINGNAGTSYTVQRAGSDIIQTGSDVTSLTGGGGDTIVLVKTGSASWALSDGSVINKYASGFGSSLATSGYQKLPSGLIMQWGSGSNQADAGGQNITLPIAFPNGPLKVLVGTLFNESLPANVSYAFISATTTTIRVYRSAPNGYGATPTFIAIGY